jgi:type IV pilus assembly protein PilM
MARGATHVLGLDIGTTAIKAAELQLRGGEVYLVGRPAVLPTPEGAVRGGVVVEAPEVADVLRELRSVYGIGCNKVVASVGGDSSVVVRITEVPKMSGKELDEAIQWELDEQTPFPVEEVIYDYAPIEPADADPEATEMEVLLAVAQEDMVNAHAEAMLDAGLRPVAIDVEPLAIGRALVEAGGDEFAEQTVVNVHIGATTTLILVFRQKLLSFVRVIPSAGGNLTQAVAQAFMIDQEMAERVKVQLGDLGDGAYAAAAGPAEAEAPEAMLEEAEEGIESDSVFELSSTGEESASIDVPDDRATHLEIEDIGELELPPTEAEPSAPESAEGPAEGGADSELAYAKDQVAEILTTPVLDIATEVRRSLDFYRRQHRNEAVDRILVTGGTANLAGLAGLVAEETGVATEVGDPFKYIVADETEAPADYLRDIGPSAVIAVGLALRDMVPE